MFDEIDLLYVDPFGQPPGPRDEVVDCNYCDGIAVSIGRLGVYDVFRCETCGKDTYQHYKS